AAAPAGCLPVPSFLYRRGAYILRGRSPGQIPARRRIRQPHPQRRKTRRASGAGTDQVRAAHQSQDREGARPRRAGQAARARRRGDRMRRREFILALGGAAAAVWPLAARAQKAANPARIGFLPIGPPSDSYDLSLAEVFRNGLSDARLIEPRDVILDLVWVTNELEYAQAVIELISRGAKVLVPVGSGAATATKLQTTTVPIVFIQVGNPIG